MQNVETSNNIGSVAATTPLCVDLDGTLIATDLLFESVVLLAKQKPWLLVLLPLWLLRGKAVLKERIASNVRMNVATLPYREPFLNWLREEKARGCDLYLVTASDARFAQAVADHLGIFAGWRASNGTVNLSGRKKRELLVREFGEGGFRYAGNAHVDGEVWAHSSGAVVIGSRAVADVAAKTVPVERFFEMPGLRLKKILKAIRVHQWVKNILVFTVLFTSQRALNSGTWVSAIVAFFAVSLCASAIYVVNDLLDLESDRRHPTKCNRPFASGEVPILLGIFLSPMLLVAGLSLGFLLPLEARVLICVYPIISLTYSFFLKRKMLVDLFALAILYTLRILVGGAATQTPVSSWLLGFSIFFFLSLALAKRASELFNLKKRSLDNASGRDYFVWDLLQIHIFGGASAFASGIILALYVHSPAIGTLYKQPSWLWITVIAVIYWVCRIWMLANRGALNEDPISFAVRDRLTYLIGVAVLISAFLATSSSIPLPGVQP